MPTDFWTPETLSKELLRRMDELGPGTLMEVWPDEFASLRSLLAKADAILASSRAWSEEAVEALRRIERWFGEFPETGRFWDKEKQEPMSYAAAFGSNGERDYMRGIACDALAALPAPGVTPLEEGTLAVAKRGIVNLREALHKVGLAVEREFNASNTDAVWGILGEIRDTVRVALEDPHANKTLSAPAPLNPAGDGEWILVPREPTDAMLQGACAKHTPGQPMATDPKRPHAHVECPAFRRRRQIWRDMIATSPPPDPIDTGSAATESTSTRSGRDG